MKRTRVPDGFEVTPRIMELAKENGWPDPPKEVEAFKDYHLAKGSLMVDWEAAFRTWLRNASRFKSKVYTQDPKPIKCREDRPNEPVAFDPKVTDMVHNLAKKFAGEE